MLTKRSIIQEIHIFKFAKPSIQKAGPQNIQHNILSCLWHVLIGNFTWHTHYTSWKYKIKFGDIGGENQEESSKSQRRLQRNNWDCIRLGERPGRDRGGRGIWRGTITYHHIAVQDKHWQNIFFLFFWISRCIASLDLIFVTAAQQYFKSLIVKPHYSIWHLIHHLATTWLSFLLAPVQHICLSSCSAHVVRMDTLPQTPFLMFSWWW